MNSKKCCDSVLISCLHLFIFYLRSVLSHRLSDIILFAFCGGVVFSLKIIHLCCDLRQLYLQLKDCIKDCSFFFNDYYFIQKEFSLFLFILNTYFQISMFFILFKNKRLFNGNIFFPFFVFKYRHSKYTF